MSHGNWYLLDNTLKHLNFIVITLDTFYFNGESRSLWNDDALKMAGYFLFFLDLTVLETEYVIRDRIDPRTFPEVDNNLSQFNSDGGRFSTLI